MFDPDLIESYPPETQETIKVAVTSLFSTGVLEAQKERLYGRVLQGSDSEKPEDLVKRILEFRKQSYALTSLIQLATQLITERDNANQ